MSTVSVAIHYSGEALRLVDAVEYDLISVWGEDFRIQGKLADLELLAKDILEGIANIKKEREDRELSQQLDNAVNFFSP